MICSSIIEREVDSMIDVANSTTSELVELRLDYLNDFAPLDKLKEIRKPIITTCMPSFEGGDFKGEEEERIEILRKTLEFADHLTIELRTETGRRETIIGEAKERGIKVIVSYHDFNSTPDKDKILSIIEDEAEAGADITKVAFASNNQKDVLNTLAAITENPTNLPVIAIAMGEHGKISRILGPPLGSYLTYASVNKGKESAPGQLTVEELRKIIGIIEK